MSYHRPMGDYYPAQGRGDWGDVWAGVKEVGKVALGGLIGAWGQSVSGQAPPPRHHATRRPPCRARPTSGRRSGRRT